LIYTLKFLTKLPPHFLLGASCAYQVWGEKPLIFDKTFDCVH